MGRQEEELFITRRDVMRLYGELDLVITEEEADEMIFDANHDSNPHGVSFDNWWDTITTVHDSEIDREIEQAIRPAAVLTELNHNTAPGTASIPYAFVERAQRLMLEPVVQSGESTRAESPGRLLSQEEGTSTPSLSSSASSLSSSPDSPPPFFELFDRIDDDEVGWITIDVLSSEDAPEPSGESTAVASKRVTIQFVEDDDSQTKGEPQAGEKMAEPSEDGKMASHDDVEVEHITMPPSSGMWMSLASHASTLPQMRLGGRRGHKRGERASRKISNRERADAGSSTLPTLPLSSSADADADAAAAPASESALFTSSSSIAATAALSSERASPGKREGRSDTPRLFHVRRDPTPSIKTELGLGLEASPFVDPSLHMVGPRSMVQRHLRGPRKTPRVDDVRETAPVSHARRLGTFTSATLSLSSESPFKEPPRSRPPTALRRASEASDV